MTMSELRDRVFFNPANAEYVKVKPNGYVYDPETGEHFDAITLAFLEESEFWYELDYDPFSVRIL